MNTQKDMLSLHRGDLGALQVHVSAPADWRGTATAMVRRWAPDGNSIERVYQLSFEVEEALVGLPPSVPCLPPDVWGATVALVVEAYVRTRAMGLVAQATIALPADMPRFVRND